MNYRNAEMKIDQLVSYLNEEKINLSPAFQRGHVWSLKTRQNLIRNIVQGKPIPAVFLYKEAIGSKYSYNILDGKQRLESIILFVGNNRKDVQIKSWNKYFFNNAIRKQANFSVALQEGNFEFAKLGDDLIRDFREYTIPTIEISLDDDSSLDEVISLFVDINQQGEPVKRFDIVKALSKSDPLLKNVFGLIAVEQKRGQDVFYKAKSNDFTAVLKKLQLIDRIASPNHKVDKMWEKLLEISLFVRTKKHRKSVEVLKEFIAKKTPAEKLSKDETKTLKETFAFLRGLLPNFGDSKLFIDQTHFYTLATSLLGADLINKYSKKDIVTKLGRIRDLIEGAGKKATGEVREKVEEYLTLSTKQTTDASRRSTRDKLFVALLDLV